MLRWLSDPRRTVRGILAAGRALRRLGGGRGRATRGCVADSGMVRDAVHSSPVRSPLHLGRNRRVAGRRDVAGGPCHSRGNLDAALADMGRRPPIRVARGPFRGNRDTRRELAGYQTLLATMSWLIVVLLVGGTALRPERKIDASWPTSFGRWAATRRKRSPGD